MQQKVPLLIILFFSAKILCMQVSKSKIRHAQLKNIYKSQSNKQRQITKKQLERKTFYSKFPLILTSPESQRENWSTGFIAEPIATVTNIGLFLAAYKNKDTAPLSAAALTAAGIASAVSHAIPFNILNIIDKIAAAASVGAVIYDAQLYQPINLIKTLQNPIATGLLATTGLTYGIDTYIPRSTIQRKDWHKYIHGAWHILAALLANIALTLSLSNP